MDLNLVLLCGRLVAPPDTHLQDGVAPHTRYLIGVGSNSQSRSTINVIPVTLVEPTEEQLAAGKGDRMWFVGSLERRFIDGVKSRLEVLANSAGEGRVHS